MSNDTMTRIGAQRPRLSSLPADIANSAAGDEVIDYAEWFGLVLDDWQRWVVRNLCAERSDGSWAATQGVLLVPRQAGKSAILEALELTALMLWDYEHVIYSAHLQKTSTDHMRRLRRHIQRTPDLDRQLRVLTGKGDERVERRDTGAIIEFITRGKKTSRGGSPGMVIFDEALFLQDDEIQSMVPALSAQSMNEDAAAQMIYTSSAPLAESTVLHRLRNRAINDRPRRMFFAEWSVLPDADPSDRDNWYLANPGLGIHISEEWVEDNEFGTLSPEAFLTERLGVPEEPAGDAVQVIASSVWDALADDRSTIVSHSQRALTVSPGRDWAAVSAAGRTSEGKLQVEWIIHRRMVDKGESSVIDHCVAAWKETGIPLRIHKNGPEASFIAPLRERGVEVVEVSTAELAQATGQLIDAAIAGELVHLGQPSLDKALRGAVLRTSTDGASVWSQRTSTVEITPLIACTVALGGVPAVEPEPRIHVWQGGAKR